MVPLKIISLILIALLLTSITVPATSAIAPAVPAAVVVYDISYEAITLALCFFVAVLADDLSLETVDQTVNEHSNPKADPCAKMSQLMDTSEWIDITSNEAKDLINAVYDCYISCGMKSDGKWYFKVHRDPNTDKIKICPGGMDVNQAVLWIKQGKDFVTLNKELVKKAIGIFKQLPNNQINKLKIFDAHKSIDGYYPHCHCNGAHCWCLKK